MQKHKKNKRKLLKTDPNRYHSFTLSDFILIDENGCIQSNEHKTQVINYLTNLSHLMKENEDYYYQNDYQNLINTLSQTTTKIGSFKQAYLRKYIPQAHHLPEEQTYNFSEMFRQNIGNTIEIYTQREILQDIIKNNPEYTPYQIQQAYIDLKQTKDYPTTSAIKKYKKAITNTGTIHSLPTSTGKLPLSACDGHYREISCKENYIRIGIRIHKKMEYLVFKKPAGHDKTYYAGRITMPTIRISAAGNLVFDFACVHARPRKKSLSECSGVLGIDSGVCHEFVGSFVSKDGSCSQPFVESGVGVRLRDRIDGLWGEIDGLEAKAVLCCKCGWFDKADVLRDEASARRAVISRLKRERAVVGACEVVGLALVLGAGVVLEDLSWVPESHWDQAEFKRFVGELAADVGLPVFRVGAAGSSGLCARDGGLCSCGSSRELVCSCCGRVLDRDVSASRVLACRGLGRACVSGFSHVRVGSRGHRASCVFLARLASLVEAGYGDVLSSAVSSPLIASEDDASIAYTAFSHFPTD